MLSQKDVIQWYHRAYSTALYSVNFEQFARTAVNGKKQSL